MSFNLFQKQNYRSYVSNGNTILLAYFPDTKNIIYCGIHKGEISGKDIVVESFTNIMGLFLRIRELDLNLTREQATEIIKREKMKTVSLPENIRNQILKYIENRSTGT